MSAGFGRYERGTPVFPGNVRYGVSVAPSGTTVNVAMRLRLSLT